MTDDNIKEVINRTSIVEVINSTVSLKKKGNNYLKYDKQIYQYLGGTQYDMKSVNTFYNSKYSGYILGTNSNDKREYFNARNIYTCGTTLQYQLLQELGLQLKHNYDPEEDNVDTYIRMESTKKELNDLLWQDLMDEYEMENNDELNLLDDNEEEPDNFPHLYDKPGINDLTSFANIKLIKGDSIYQNPFYQPTFSKMLNCGKTTFAQWMMLNPKRNLDKIKSASINFWDKLSIATKNMFENSLESFQKTTLWLAWKFGETWRMFLFKLTSLTEEENNAMQNDIVEAYRVNPDKNFNVEGDEMIEEKKARIFATTYIAQNDLYQRCI